MPLDTGIAVTKFFIFLLPATLTNGCRNTYPSSFLQAQALGCAGAAECQATPSRCVSRRDHVPGSSSRRDQAPGWSSPRPSPRVVEPETKPPGGRARRDQAPGWSSPSRPLQGGRPPSDVNDLDKLDHPVSPPTQAVRRRRVAAPTARPASANPTTTARSDQTSLTTPPKPSVLVVATAVIASTAYESGSTFEMASSAGGISSRGRKSPHSRSCGITTAGMNCTAWNSVRANAETNSPSAVPSTASAT